MSIWTFARGAFGAAGFFFRGLQRVNGDVP